MTELMKLTEIPSPINEEAMNPELVEAIRRAKQSGPVMITNEFKAWLDRYTGLSPMSSLTHCRAGRASRYRVPAEHMGADRQEA